MNLSKGFTVSKDSNHFNEYQYPVRVGGLLITDKLITYKLITYTLITDTLITDKLIT